MTKDNKPKSSEASANGVNDIVKSVEPWTEKVDGRALLDEIYSNIRRFIVCEAHTARAATLWTAFTWFIDHVKTAPIAVITAPEKRCGKTELLKLIGKMSRRPLPTSNISPAVIFRTIEAVRPTLLIDEVDSFLKDNEALRGILNSGHSPETAFVLRTVGDNHDPQKFSTWGAKVLCGIGKLADTIMDRSIVLEMRRKLKTENVESQRHADRSQFIRISRMLARWAQDAGPEIQEARPVLPDALNDRAQENWEPLLAIADHAGGEWPEFARKAALKISGSGEDTASVNEELLKDIQEYLKGKSNASEQVPTSVLVDALNEDDEKPWKTFDRGQPLKSHQLSRKLRGYGVTSKNIRVGGDKVVKGYSKWELAAVCNRYLPPEVETRLDVDNAATPLQKVDITTNTRGYDVADSSSRSVNDTKAATDILREDQGCSDVADEPPYDAHGKPSAAVLNRIGESMGFKDIEDDLPF